MISQKCQYAIRAVFELSRQYGQGPVKISHIAEQQDIPVKFLEVILNQLKTGDFVDSKRGSSGGYFLMQYPENITVGQIITFIQGTVKPVSCVESAGSGNQCSLKNKCVFLPMWRKVHEAVTDVYDKTTFADLVRQDAAENQQDKICYSI